MRTRVLLGLGLLAVITATGFLLLMWANPASRVNKARFERLKNSMLPEEVAEILGGPGSEPCKHVQDVSYIGEIIHVGFARDVVDDVVDQKEWTGHGQSIVVGFDRSGRAATFEYYRFSESLLDRLRRWLRIS
jgi:hypothetical protein